ncbi:MAG: hypothetical protein LIP03_05490 [Bacteroidales bacterium]|nr:hypothetical protein [Bacteroidales bacterium]
MNTFSFKRYFQLMVDALRSNAKDTLMVVGIALGVIFGIVLWMVGTKNCFYDYDAPMGRDYMWETERIYFWIGFLAVAFCGASMIFSPLSTKTSSIAYLMQPATQLEKYLSRWTLMVPVSLIVYILGFEVIDLLRCLFTIILYGSNPNVIPIGFHFLTPRDPQDGWIPVFLILAVQSFYALGGSIWPKRAFLFTSLFLIILNIALSIWTAGIFTWMMKGYYWKKLCIPFDDWSPVLIAGIFAFVVCAINYTLAYYRFKEAEIIKRW